MAASVAELILARVAALLLNATAAAAKVYRARDDAFGQDDTRAINIRRTTTDGDSIGNNGERIYVGWEIEHHVRGGEIETDADALHMEVHALLAGDSILAGKGKGLRCLGTSLETESSDKRVAKLTARYQMQVFVRPGDLTKAIN